MSGPAAFEVWDTAGNQIVGSMDTYPGAEAIAAAFRALNPGDHYVVVPAGDYDPVQARRKRLSGIAQAWKLGGAYPVDSETIQRAVRDVWYLLGLVVESTNGE